MIRQEIAARPDWQPLVESQGYTWHSDGEGYGWNESAAYVLTADEARLLWTSAEEARDLYRQAAEHIVKRGLWERVGISPGDAPFIRASWERADFSLAGRFDFLWDASGQPRLLEFNADGALTLLETAVIQREWQRAVLPELAQFNDLHEPLVAAWKNSDFSHVHCAWRPRHREIEGTISYMARVIREAGLKATMIALHCIGWNRKSSRFVDGDGAAIECCYKIYPWEWLLREPFAEHVDHCRFVEPASKLLFANKGILTVLWELFPGHPVLLPCFDDPTKLASDFISKPLLGREGQNIAIHSGGRVLQKTGGEFLRQRCVYQELVRSPRYDGWLQQLGVWLVGEKAVALGIRETSEHIVTEHSPFAPHAIG